MSVSAAEFLQFPSPTKLQNISSHRSIVQHLGESSKDVEQTLTAFVKVASVVRKDDQKTKNIAIECADDLLGALLEGQDDKENMYSTFTNALLVHLGLLKSEDKKFSACSNLTGPLIVLEHVVKQKYFPQPCRNILQVFLGKSHPALDSCKEVQHNLLQTLYKF